eukprot:scaffold68172_cov63-Phaeocystis_antarctica.AAC.3
MLRVALRVHLLVPREDVLRHAVALGLVLVPVWVEDAQAVPIAVDAHLVHVASAAHLVRPDVVGDLHVRVEARQPVHRQVEVDADVAGVLGPERDWHGALVEVELSRELYLAEERVLLSDQPAYCEHRYYG